MLSFFLVATAYCGVASSGMEPCCVLLYAVVVVLVAVTPACFAYRLHAPFCPPHFDLASAIRKTLHTYIHTFTYILYIQTCIHIYTIIYIHVSVISAKVRKFRFINFYLYECDFLFFLCLCRFYGNIFFTLFPALFNIFVVVIVII